MQAWIAPIVIYGIFSVLGYSLWNAVYESLSRKDGFPWIELFPIAIVLIFYAVGGYLLVRAIRMQIQEIRMPHVVMWPVAGNFLGRDGVTVRYSLTQNPIRVTMFQIRLVCTYKDEGSGERDPRIQTFLEQKLCRVDSPRASVEGTFDVVPKRVPPEEEREWVVRWELVVTGHDEKGRKWEDRYDFA